MCILSFQQGKKYFFRSQPGESITEEKLKKKPIKRGRGKNKNKLCKNLTIIGNNVAGLKGKSKSLEKIIEHFLPGVILLQETKVRNTNQLKLPGFTIFEKLRNNSEGGGLMSIVHNNLKPTLISSENSEFLEVDICGNFGTIRTINSYGPQEYWSLEVRIDYFTELESRIIIAKSEQKLICIEGDINSKLGNRIIPGDPHTISQNGKLLNEIISRQDLIVVNATEKCRGIITRYKKTVRGEEKSILDYFIVCRQLYQKIQQMTIDEERRFVLSRFYKTKNAIKCVESDHNLLILQLRLGWDQKIKSERKEIYNLRNMEGQKVFKQLSSNNPNFIKVLSNDNISSGGRKWLKEVQHIICKSFKKIRLSRTKPPLKKETQELFTKREKIKKRMANCLNRDTEEYNAIKAELDMVEEAIAEIEAQENFMFVKKNVEHLVDNTDNLNPVRMWQLRKKLCPNKAEPPTAKKK